MKSASGDDMLMVGDVRCGISSDKFGLKTFLCAQREGPHPRQRNKKQSISRRLCQMRSAMMPKVIPRLYLSFNNTFSNACENELNESKEMNMQF